MDYQNGRIYKIVNDVCDDIYIGSTTQPLSKRIAMHRSKAKEKPQRRIYQKFNEIGVEHFKIVLIEEYKCNNKEELVAREDYYIRLMKPDLNSRHAHRTDLQKKDYDKDYYSINKDTIKQYRSNNKDKINQYSKDYYSKNKEKLNQNTKEYRTKNKSKLHTRGIVDIVDMMQEEVDTITTNIVI